MTGNWKVTSNRINDELMYAVYRLKDVSVLDHSGNREYATGYIGKRHIAYVVSVELNTGVKIKKDLTDDEVRQVGELVANYRKEQRP